MRYIPIKHMNNSMSVKIEKLKVHADKRGKLIEIFKFSQCGQVYLITAPSGAIRGNHFHKRKIEKFCVIEGSAKLNLRNLKTGNKKKYILSGSRFKVITVPPGWVHNIVNAGKREMKVLTWTNEVFNPKDSDTFPENV